MENNFTYKKMVMGIIIIVMVISIPVDIVFALKSPSSVYCEQMGYEWVIETTEIGQMGVCKFSETESCPGWDFLTGKCGEEYSYCSEKGYQLKTVDDYEKCSSIPLSTECAVCVLENRTEVEVTKLMGLSFEEGVCGDGVCVLGENYNNCPQDCPSGSSDFYCDGILDGICDPDCTLEEDIDCLCGDGVCEVNETQEGCCFDCGCPPGMKCVENKCIEDRCGNNLCEPNYGENYKTCPQDCPTGIEINFIIVLSVVLVVVLIIIILLYKKKKGRVKYI